MIKKKKRKTHRNETKIERRRRKERKVVRVPTAPEAPSQILLRSDSTWKSVGYRKNEVKNQNQAK